MQSPYQRISASKSTFLPWMPTSTLLPWITVMHTLSTDRCVHLPLLTCIHTCIYLETVCPHIYRIRRCIPVCSHVSKVAQWIYASMVDACVETPYKGTRPITAVTQSRREDMGQTVVHGPVTGSAVGAVFWRGVTHVGGCNQKMWLYATLQICLGRASRMARAGVGENAELETRVAKRCWGGGGAA